MMQLSSPFRTGPYWYTCEEIALAVKSGLTEGPRASVGEGVRWLAEGINFLEHAAENDDLTRCLVEPTTRIDERWDTLIAAAVRYRLRTIGVRAPKWTFKEPLTTMWFPGARTERPITAAINLAPLELRRVGIMLPAIALDLKFDKYEGGARFEQSQREQLGGPK